MDTRIKSRRSATPFTDIAIGVESVSRNWINFPTSYILTAKHRYLPAFEIKWLFDATKIDDKAEYFKFLSNLLSMAIYSKPPSVSKEERGIDSYGYDWERKEWFIHDGEELIYPNYEN